MFGACLLALIGVCYSVASPVRVDGGLRIIDVFPSGVRSLYIHTFADPLILYKLQFATERQQLPLSWGTGVRRGGTLVKNPPQHPVCTGTPVSVVGDIINGTTIVLDSFNNISSLLPSTAQNIITSPPKGAVKVLIIIHQFNGGRPAMTKQQVEQRIIAPARVFFNNCSYGRVKLDPQYLIVGPVSIGPRAGCPGFATAFEWMSIARKEVCVCM